MRARGTQSSFQNSHTYTQLPLSSALFPLKLTLQLPPLLDVKGCEEEGVCLSFSPLSVGSPQRHSDYYSLPPPPEGLFNR